jgi:hypothetical protein
VVPGPAQEQQPALCGLLRGRVRGLAAAGRVAGAATARDPGRQGAARGRLRVQQGRLLADFRPDVATRDAGLQPGHVMRLILRFHLRHRGSSLPAYQPLSRQQTKPAPARDSRASAVDGLPALQATSCTAHAASVTPSTSQQPVHRGQLTALLSAMNQQAFFLMHNDQGGLSFQYAQRRLPAPPSCLRKGMQHSTTAARVSVALDEQPPKMFQGGVQKICADQYAIFRSGADLHSLAFGGFKRLAVCTGDTTRLTAVKLHCGAHCVRSTSSC